MALFSSEIRLYPEELYNAAEKIIDFSEQIEDVFDQISNSLSFAESSGGWKGADINALKNATEKNDSKYSQILTELENLSGFLEHYAKEMNDKDQELKEKIISC